MKKFYLLLATIFISLFISQNLNAQLQGIKYIPGDYATISAAVDDLNAQGVGSGGVTFLVAAGHTESITSSIIIRATGTSSNTITFQKNGTGANPIITRTDAGTLSTSVLGGQGDAVIIIQGGDYITFDGIDVATSQSGIEYGYFLRKVSGTNGCKYVTIKNCTVDLTKGTSQYVCGIYVSNLDSASLVSSATGITVTSTGGRNEYITIKGCTIQDVFTGILLRGFNHTSSPYDFYDHFFTIGAEGESNTIQNFAGNSANTAYGVYAIYHDSLTVSYNTINNTANGGSNFTSTGYGIFHSTSTNGSGFYNNNNITLSSNTGQLRGIMSGTSGVATLTANYNTITLSQAGTTEATCIYFQSLSAGSTIQINNNTFGYGTSFASTSTSYLIYASTAASNVTVQNNQTTGSINKTGTSGTFYCFYNFGSPTGGVGTISNNNFSNITLAGTSVFYGIYYQASTSQPKNIYNNTISNISGASGSIYGISTNYDGTTTNVYGNQINNLNSTSGGTIYAMQIGGSSSSGTLNCYENTIHTLSTSASIYGINLNSTTGAIFSTYRNRIYNLNATGSSSVIYPINVASGPTHYIYNNFISELFTPSSSQTNAIAGIWVTSSTSGSNIGVYFNTIYLNATSSGTNFGTSGLSTTTTPTVDLRNNIIVNNSTPNGTGLTVAYRRSSTTLTTYASTSNNNLFFAGTPSANRLIFNDGTNSDQTITAYKTRVSPRDANSFTENPPFVNVTTPPYDLHINPSVPTQIESGGIPITSPISITTDYDGNTRNATTPDVGADEGNFTGLDFNPPNISYTPLGNSIVASSRTLTNFATITDPSGVNQNPGLAPRLYYKKKTDANTFVDNTSETNGWKYVETSNYSSPNSFEIDYSLLYGGGGVSVGDTIQYFVVAQDEAPTPNVGINSGIFNSTPASVNLDASAFPITGTINSYAILGSISGTVTVGTGGTYSSLTGAGGLFADINSKVVTGNITAQIISDLSETGANALNQWVEEGLGGYTLTIQPDAATTRTISGSYAGGLIRLNGADRVTIDGRFSGSGNYLTISNTATTGTIAAIQLISLGTGAGATNNTIRNCNISAGHNASGAYGIAIGGATVGDYANDNDNVTITENNIIRAYEAIRAGSSSTITSQLLDNLVISKNIIGSTTSSDYVIFRGIQIQGANAPILTQNEIHNMRTTGSLNIAAIDIGQYVANADISRNRIYSIYSTSSTGWGAYGINISSGTGTNNIQIVNNLIYDIMTANYSTTSTTWNAFGIRITGGTNHKVYYNSINFYGSVTSGTAAGMSANMVITTAVSGLDVRNNIFVNTQSFGVSGSFAYNIYLGTTGITFGTINRNDYYGTSSSTTTFRVGYDGSGARTTLSDWQSYTGQDQNSISADPLFQTNTDLRPSYGSPVLGAGTPISGITTDFLGVTRSATNPTIGAYEQAVDATPPVISYTPLSSTTSTSNRTLSGVNITDASGVPTSGTLQPRIYYRKNNGSYVSTQGTLVSGSGTNGNWDFLIDYSLVGGVTQGDNIYYYVIAQDVTSPPNIGSNPSGVVATDVNNVTTHPSSPNQYTILSTLAGGTYAIGPNGPYPGYDETYNNITEVANLLNNNVLTGDVIFELQSDYSSTGETFPITFNQILYSGGDWTVTIRPANGVTGIVTSGDPGSGNALFIFNGVDRLTFDGRPGGSGTSKEWIIRNSRTSATIAETFLMRNDVTDITLRNLYIEGNNSTTSGGVISILGTTGLKGNDKITLESNDIRNYTGGNPNMCIVINGQDATSKTNDTITISNNNIYNFGNNVANTNPRGVYIGNANFVSITGNSFYRTDSYSAQGLAQFVIIGATGNGPGHTISNNFFGGSAPNASGTYTITTSTSGIYVVDIFAIGSQTTPTTVSGNVIRGFNLTTAADPASNTIYFCGIFHRSSAGTVNITNNVIGDSTVNAENSPSILFTANGASTSNFSVVEGIDVRAGTGQISGNKISGIRMTKVAQRNCTFTGIGHYTAGTANITNNLIGSRVESLDNKLKNEVSLNDNISNELKKFEQSENYVANKTISKSNERDKELIINQDLTAQVAEAVDLPIVTDNNEKLMKKPGDKSSELNIDNIKTESKNSENSDVINSKGNEIITDNVVIPNISQETAGSVLGIGIGVGGTISGNVIANIKMNSTSPTTNQFFAGISISNSSVTSNNNILTNNIVRNIFNNTTGGTSYGFNCATTTPGTLTCTGNILNNFTISSSTAGTATFAGIINQTSGSYNVSNNTIQNFSSNSNSTLSTNAHNVFTGIYNVNSSASTSNLISNNVIKDITCNPFTASTQIRMQGIFNNSSTSVGTVSRNRISNFNTNTTATNSEVNGYYSYYGAEWTYVNNVFDLGGNITNDIVIYCVRDYSDNNTGNWWNNTFRVSGSVSSGSTNTAVYFRQSTASTVTSMQNNNFINERTGGTGVHMVIDNSIGATGWTLSNYNNLYSASGIVGRWANTTDRNYGEWRTTSGQDFFSISGPVTFSNSDLLIPDVNNASCWNIHGKGVQITGNNSDINGNPRSTTVSGGAPDIGAYEFTPSVSPNDATQLGSIADGQTTYYIVASDTVATITWSGSNLPSSVSVQYRSGQNPPNIPEQGTFEYGNYYIAITPSGGSGYTYDYKMYYTPALLGTISSESVTRIAQYTSGEWTTFTATPNTTEKSITVTGLTSFSHFTVSSSNAPLPIVLERFDASIKGRDVKLTWITENEHNNYGFEVERKRENEQWQKVGFVQSRGNTDGPNSYIFEDKKLNSGKYNYRLKQIDVNGNYNYFELKGTVDIALPTQYDLSQNYPNPFNPLTKIDYALPVDGKVRILIYDMLGREVKSLVNEQQKAGFYTIEFNGASISSGTYIYRIIVEGIDGSKYIMSKKMVLVK